MGKKSNDAVSEVIDRKREAQVTVHACDEVIGGQMKGGCVREVPAVVLQ
jgi:hypothetical protein